MEIGAIILSCIILSVQKFLGGAKFLSLASKSPKFSAERRKALIKRDVSRFFTELKQQLDKLNLNYLVRIFDSEVQGLQGCKHELLSFLGSSIEEIIVSHQDLVTGIEAPNGCFIMSDRRIDSGSLRCTVLGFKIDHNFLHCSNLIKIDDQYLKKTM